MRALMMTMVLALLPLACATAPRPFEVETVGTLAPSYRSIATAPVLSSDSAVSSSFAAIEGDREGVAAGEATELPEVATKHSHGF